MKTKHLIILCLLILSGWNGFCRDNLDPGIGPVRDTLVLYSTPELSGLANLWANTYSDLNPDVTFRFEKVSGSKLNLPVQPGVIGILSQESLPGYFRPQWKEIIGRDIIVPVVSAENPYKTQMMEQGISSEDLGGVFLNSNGGTWGAILNSKDDKPVDFYYVNNSRVISSMVDFLKTDEKAIPGKEFQKGSELVMAVQKNPYAVGFCRLSDVIDPLNGEINKNLMLLPIDKNANGILDYSEKIYAGPQEFARAVWIGKYPRSLYSNLYAVSAGPPAGAEKEFLKWILSTGQNYMMPEGFSDLTTSEKKSKLDALLAKNAITSVPPASVNRIGVILLFLIILAFMLVALDSFARYTNQRINFIKKETIKAAGTFGVNTVRVMNGLYYDKSHTWAFMEPSGLVKVGIDDFLQHATGNISSVQMKKAGEKVSKGETVVTIVQFGKKLNIKSPVSGIIIEPNSELDFNASPVNENPYSEGWIYRIEPSNWSREINFLLMSEKYRNWLNEEFIRLKDFLSFFSKKGNLEYAPLVLQDGGEMKDQPLAGLGPEVWEEFQVNFIDISK